MGPHRNVHPGVVHYFSHFPILLRYAQGFPQWGAQRLTPPGPWLTCTAYLEVERSDSLKNNYLYASAQADNRN